MSRRTLCPLLVLLVLLMPVSTVPAGAEIILARGVAGNGGGVVSGHHYTHNGTVGQACIGIVTGPVTIHEIGFWYPVPGAPSAVEAGGDGLPEDFSLTFAPLHPTGQRLEIRFALPVRTPVAIELYDIAGRRIRRPVDGVLDPGYHTVELTARGLTSGIYFCRMTAGDFKRTQRLTLLK